MTSESAVSVDGSDVDVEFVATTRTSYSNPPRRPVTVVDVAGGLPTTVVMTGGEAKPVVVAVTV